MNSRKDDKPRQVVEEVTIPIVEERVRLDTRVREGRTVAVHTRPVTETLTLSAPVTREHVTVERVPVNRVVETVPPVREEGDLTIIPVVEERPRIVMELVVTEEIHLRRTREQVETQVEVERRRTEIDIED